MALSPLAQFIQSRIQLIVHTGHSIVYVDRARPNVVIKAESVWIDGTPCDRAPSAENTNYHLTREARIYAALGTSPAIATFLGLDYDAEGSAIALKTERAANGCLRNFIRDAPQVPPILRRIDMGAEFTRGVVYLHSRGVIWGDLSTRNALIDSDESIKLCDFASSALEGVYPEFGMYTYEPTYRPTIPEVK